MTQTKNEVTKISSLCYTKLLLVGLLFCLSCKNDYANSKSQQNNIFDYINVKALGAKGDGKTDDTRAIQAALDQGAGKTVFIPTGNYAINKSLIISSGTEILGEGDVGGQAGSAIFPINNLNAFAIFTSNSNKLSDVIFRNIRTLKARYSLSLNVKGGYMTKVKWYNCVFQQHEVCINITGSDSEGMYANAFRDCYFKASKLGIYCQGPFNINIIQGCGFENMGDGYIKLSSSSTANLSNSFVENRCESISNKGGIAIELGKNVFGFYINRNYFENSFPIVLKTNGARNVDFSDNTYTSSSAKTGTVLVNGGQISIKNNISLTGFVLDITGGGFCSELSSNNFLSFTGNVNKINLGIVSNPYNKKFDK